MACEEIAGDLAGRLSRTVRVVTGCNGIVKAGPAGPVSDSFARTIVSFPRGYTDQWPLVIVYSRGKRHLTRQGVGSTGEARVISSKRHLDHVQEALAHVAALDGLARFRIGWGNFFSPLRFAQDSLSGVQFATSSGATRM